MCIPLQFFINLLWSISFGAKKYKEVSGITISSAIINIILNLVFIPQMGGIGAAIAFLLATLIQTGLYYKLVNKSMMSIAVAPAIIFIATAIAVYGVVTLIHVHYLVQLIIAIITYLSIPILLRQINRQHLFNFKLFLGQ